MEVSPFFLRNTVQFAATVLINSVCFLMCGTANLTLKPAVRTLYSSAAGENEQKKNPAKRMARGFRKYLALGELRSAAGGFEAVLKFS